MRAGRATCVVLAGLNMICPAAAGERLPLPSVQGIEACGPDAFRLPGSDGCIRLGGAVGTETALRLGHAAGRWTSVRTGFRADGRVTADLRVPTELGPLRVYGSLRGRRDF